MLSLIPDTPVDVIERCSGHGGTLGVRTENIDVAVKVGKPAAQAALKNNTGHIASECPLAAEHLMQVMEMTAGETKPKPSAPNIRSRSWPAPMELKEEPR